MATGYRVDGSPALLFDLGWISPAGQMFSSTRDLDIVSLLSKVILVNFTRFSTVIFLQFARFFMSNSSSLQDNFVLPWSLRKEMQIQGNYKLLLVACVCKYKIQVARYVVVLLAIAVYI